MGPETVGAKRLGVLLLAVLRLALPVGGAGVAAPASAHTALLAAEPADGAALAAPPAAVVLRFDEPVRPLTLRVVAPGGAEVALAGLPPPGSKLEAALPAALGPGVYLIGWRVVSADGHPVSGALSFGVGTAAAQATRQDDAVQAWAWLLPVLRFAFYAVAAVAAGGALFRACVAEPPLRVRRGIRLAAAFGIGLAALSVAAEGGMLADAAPRGMFDPAVWRMGAGTPLAASLGAAVLGFALVLLSGGNGAAARWSGGAGAAVLAMGLPLAGHAATAEPRWAASGALVLHAMAVLFWLGAFWPLRALLADRCGGGAPAVRRFGRAAVVAVPALLAAGVALAALRLRSPADLLGSDYGRLVLVKAGGFALLVALAAVNRRRFTPALASGRSGAAAGMSRVVLGEMAVAAAVLCATAVLVRTPPPRTAAAAPVAAPTRVPGGGASATAAAAGFAALIEIVPGRVGPNRLLLTLDRADGGAGPPPREVWAELDPPMAGIGPIRRRLHAVGGGRFTHDGSEFAVAGRWLVRIEVLVGDFEQVSLPATLVIGAAAP